MSLKSEINIYKIDIYPREGMIANEQLVAFKEQYPFCMLCTFQNQENME